MNISMFNDWIEEKQFGDSELASLLADIVDEAMAHDVPGENSPAERADKSHMASAWQAAQNEPLEIRIRTAVVLGHLGFDKALPGLELARAADDPILAGAAAVVIARFKGVDAQLMQDLVKAADDPAAPHELRSAAARAIANKNTPEAVSVLVKMANSDDPDSAQYGIEGLGLVKPTPELHATVLQALLDALAKSDPLHKLSAVEALGEFGDQEAIRPLEMTLIEKDPSLRRRVIFALTKLGADSAKAPLARMLRDHNVPARWEIVDLVGRCCGETTVEALAAVLRENDPELHDHVVSALAKMSGTESLDLLKKIAAENRDGFVREQAAAAIKKRAAAASEPVTRPSAKVEAISEESVPKAPFGGAPPPPDASAPPRLHKLAPLHTTPSAGQAGNVVEKALEAMDCTWRRDAAGYHAEVPVGTGRESVSILVNEVDYEQTPIYRFVVNCGQADSAAFDVALKNNLALDYGALGIDDTDGTQKFVLTETLLASAASVAAVRKIVTSLARFAAELRG